ncbi:MAG TPA: DNA-binding protein [Nitrososphaera sp.]|jgi:DNA-binding TFAR19-related protein (PDSD5 family)|nr:DNA-binding protein [Nitrososphaera sp.]
MPADDPEIDLINARKLRELREKAAAMEKVKASRHQQPLPKSSREIVSTYLYDRGDEVLELAYGQYPVQTEAIVTRIATLILSGEITSRISGGELLMLFRSVGLNIRVNTTIKVEDDGKLISFSEKLKKATAEEE